VFAPAPSISARETSGPLGRGTGPGQRTGRECDDAGRHRSEEHPACEPGAAPGGQREEGLEPLLGLLSPKRRDLRCAEEAHREEEEHEGEPEPAGRSDDRPGAELLELALHVLGDDIRRDGVGDDAHQERERADSGEPGDEAATLGAHRLLER
jgi:hypothetical protein